MLFWSPRTFSGIDYRDCHIWVYFDETQEGGEDQLGHKIFPPHPMHARLLAFIALAPEMDTHTQMSKEEFEAWTEGIDDEMPGRNG